MPWEPDVKCEVSVRNHDLGNIDKLGTSGPCTHRGPKVKESNSQRNLSSMRIYSSRKFSFSYRIFKIKLKICVIPRSVMFDYTCKAKSICELDSNYNNAPPYVTTITFASCGSTSVHIICKQMTVIYKTLYKLFSNKQPILTKRRKHSS